MSKEDYQKEFCSLMDTFNHKYSRWNVWNDFLQITAISMANVFPNEKTKEREETFKRIIDKYSEEEYGVFAIMLKVIVDALEDNPEQDFLGEVYHRLKLNQHQKGQFFTPYHICDFMSEIQFVDSEEQLKEKDYITVSDPACGAGAMLIAFANVALKHKVNYQQKVLFVAQDIDMTAALMCYIQLSLLGCSAIVICGDSLAKPGLHPDNDVWITVMSYLNISKLTDFLSQKEKLPDILIQKEYPEDKNGQLRLELVNG